MKIVALLAALTLAGAGCYSETQTTRTTWVAPPGGNWVRPGRVQQVQEVTQRVEGNPGAGALAGALIGGILLGHHGHPSLFGAAAGAAVGAAASSGGSERRTYQVLVLFDDGESGLFLYRDWSPFRPGDLVVLTPQGLARQ